MRPSIQKLFLILFLLGCWQYAKAQTDNEKLLERLALNQALYPPESILSTKSIVLLSVPEVSDRAEWIVLVDQLQQFLANEGVDAVAYIEIESLFAIPNKVLQVPDFLNKREIKNLILFAAKNEESPVFLAFGAYNGKETFYEKGSIFWARSATKLETITSELTSYFKTGALYRDNLLINESPELFYPKVDLGIVAKSIPPKLAAFKVAIAPIDISAFDQFSLASFRYDNFLNEEGFQAKLKNRNARLEMIARDSTNNIFIKDKSKTNQMLRRDGFQYELTFVSDTDTRVYDWLPFPDRPKPTGNLIHKFYLNDLRNNNIYVGKTWDASTDWGTALSNFLAQMDEVLEKTGG